MKIRLFFLCSARFNGKDTLVAVSSSPAARMIVWYDTTGCSSCRINRLYEWEELLAYSKALRDKFQFFFVMTPKTADMESIRFSLMTYPINHPVWIDTASYFARANPQVPIGDRFHTFLLDRDNRVVQVGDPTTEESLMNRYKKTIKRLVNNGGQLPE